MNFGCRNNEATSSLDTKAEREVKDAIDQIIEAIDQWYTLRIRRQLFDEGLDTMNLPNDDRSEATDTVDDHVCIL